MALTVGLLTKPAYGGVNSQLVGRYINSEINPAPAKKWDEILEPQLVRRQEQIRLEEERIAREAAEAEAKRIAEEQARLEAEAAQLRLLGLTGSYGYASPYGNCVNEPGVNNPGWGNPIDWPVTSFSPWIGATALWTYNHVGVVVGIWGNGDLEIRHQNFSGGQTRFPASAFRGFR